MSAALLAGALFGLGLFLLVQALFPARPGIAARLLALDLAGADRRPEISVVTKHERVGELRRKIGERMADFYAERGWELRSTRADLALLGRTWEGFLATKFLLAAGGLIIIPLLAAWLALLGLGVSLSVPLWGALLLATFLFFLPDLQLRKDAGKRRRDFRIAVSAFLDLVAMNLAGGRGVPEALMAAASIGDGWAMWRIRDALSNARITGITPWAALGHLGEEVNIEELRDLSAALTLVADDGAKVRESLKARAATMRRRELAELEGKAGERSQSMLVAQLMLCTGFLIFLGYPALFRVLSV